MSSIVISGDTSGSVTLQAPATAGSTTLTLPAVSGTVVLNNSTDQTINGLTVGKGAGLDSGSTVLGNGALAGSNTGANNLAVGRNSLAVNTSGAQNSALGYATLNANTTGADNVAVGHIALYGNTTGSSNVAVGRQALQANTTGNSNTAVGYQAGYSNTTGANLCAFGRIAGYNNTTANDNTNIGVQAGYTNSTGASNTYVGTSAGYSATGGSNTFIGQGAGELITSGAKNSVLGRYNGNQGGLDIRTASNYIVLSDGDGNLAYVNANGSNFFGASPAPGYGANAVLVPVYDGSARPGMRMYNTQTGSSASTEINFIRNTTSVGQIYTTNNATAYITSSDYRLKEDIVPMTDALDTVAQLKPVKYKWKSDSKEGQGFIAHEMQEVFPESVYGTKDGVDAEGNPEYQGIDTSFLVATLTAAIQELNAKVIELEAKLESK